MPADWRIASSRVTAKAAITASTGKRVSTPPRRMPGGKLHAYEVGQPTTACGRDVAPLRLWPTRPFMRGGQARDRCLDCLERLRG